MLSLEVSWLDIAWLGLIFAHFGLFGVYILCMRAIALRKPWNVNMSANYRPGIAIVIPTYNEAAVIEKKLDNLVGVDYPEEKVEIIVVDGASTDGTPEAVRKWKERHSREKTRRLTLIEEIERSGMTHGVNAGMKSASSELVAISDAECTWCPDALKNAVKYLADSRVVMVSGVHRIIEPKTTTATQSEKAYRNIYRLVRIGESKLFGTPIHEGELVLFRRNVLKKIPEDMGSPETAAAVLAMNEGYRAITVPDAVFLEPTPYTWRERFRQKVRRGQHVIQALVRYKGSMFKGNIFFSLILPFEFYIHVLNPVIWIVLLPVTFLFLLTRPVFLALLLFLAVPNVRIAAITHMTNMSIMVAALMNELRGQRQTMWTKIGETRP